MPPSFDSLSDELVDRVVSFTTSQSYLASLALVSKRIYYITLPHLYADVSFRESEANRATNYLTSFVLLILERPSLASLIQSFSYRHMYSTPEYDGGQWPARSDSDTIARSAVNAAARDEQEAKIWFAALQKAQNIAAILGLLLVALTNLRRLDLPLDLDEHDEGNNEEEGPQYITRLTRRVAHRQKPFDKHTPFAKLADIMIAGTNDKYPDDPDSLGTYMGFPAVQRLYGFNLGNDDDETGSESILELQPSSSPIQFIELRKSKLNALNLTALLKAPKGLKTLIYEIGNTWAWCSVHTKDIQAALGPQKDSLEALWLDHTDFYPFLPAPDGSEELDPMTFSEYKVLKHLKIAPIYLYGDEALRLEFHVNTRSADAPLSQEGIEASRRILVDALPASLETLHFRHCQDPDTLRRLSASLQQLVEFKSERFPALHKIIIEGAFEEHGSDVDVVKDAFQVAKSSGITTVVLHRSNDAGYTESVVRPWGWDEDVEWEECINDYYKPAVVIESNVPESK